MAIDTRSTNADPSTGNVVPTGYRINWGAVFAGVILFMALSWLLLLLGAAFGAGIADATDLAAIGDGLGVGSVIWILLSSIVATFAGALLAAKLDGTPDDRIGALHGLTVWSVGTLLIMLLGASATGSAVNAISGAFTSATQVSSTAITSTAGGDESDLLPDSVVTSAAAIFKRQASRVVSATARGNDAPSRSEVQSAINSMSAEDIGAVASSLVSGDNDQAREQLAQRSGLTSSQIDSIIQGAETRAQQWSESGDLQSAENWLGKQVSEARRSVSQAASEIAGTEMSSEEVNRALRELDSETLIEAGQYLLMGAPEMSKDVLTTNTSLSEADIEAVVNGTEQEAQEIIDQAQAQLNETTEAIGAYTQAALWSAFIAGALGLIAGLVGGHIGAGTIQRSYATR